MKITKRKNGLLQIAINNPRTGKRVFIYGRTEAEVRKKVKEKQKEFCFSENDSCNLTLAYCIDEWFKTHSQSGIAFHTINSYVKPVEDCKNFFGSMKLFDVLPQDVDNFIQHLIDCDYARQTINLRYIVLCKTFDWAIKNRLITQNAARQTALPRGLKSSIRGRLTTQQVAKVKESKNLYANMLLYTGTRRCECLAIQWQDIDFDKKEIFIHQQVLWERNEPPRLAPLKTKNSQAYIPLLKPLEELLLPIRKEKGFVFNKNGNLLTEGQFVVMWEKYKKEIGENICPHQFRHEYISILHDAGIDVKSAQALARHSKFETTMNIYTKLNENSNSVLGEKINNFLSDDDK